MIECVYGDETIKYFYSDVVIDPSSVEAWRLIGEQPSAKAKGFLAQFISKSYRR